MVALKMVGATGVDVRSFFGGLGQIRQQLDATKRSKKIVF